MPFLNDISLGQYFPLDSFFHRLDPRTKLISVLSLMTGLLVSYRTLPLLLFFVVTIIFLFASRLPLLLVLKNVRPFIWLFLLTMLVHVFLTPGQVIWRIPYLEWSISGEGIRLGVVYSFRLFLLIIIAALLTLTTSPVELTDGLEKLLKPLKKIKVPVHEIVMMLTLSLRFIPTLLEEAQRIKNAQLSRGVSFEGSLINRVKNIVPLILPLFFSAFRRADELAMAMDSRCYTGGEGRTSYLSLSFRAADIMILCVSLLMIPAALFFG